jgi:hypothetical protein
MLIVLRWRCRRPSRERAPVPRRANGYVVRGGLMYVVQQVRMLPSRQGSVCCLKSELDGNDATKEAGFC